MSLHLTLYELAKKSNSTLMPTASTPSSGTLLCTLKESCGIINPSVEVALSGNPTSYNYAYLQEFNRYYFIDDWVYTNGVWDVSMSVDVLASFKTNIGNSSHYILRSASSHDGTLIDNYYPTKYGATITTNYPAANPFESDIEDGCYIVGLIGQGTASDPGVGGVKYVAFNQSQINEFMSYMFSNITYMGTIDEIGESLTRALVNPFQYVASCQWFPFPVTAFSQGSSSNTHFGWWVMNKSHYIINDAWVNKTITVSINIPKHPQATTRGQYLNMQPFSKYMLDFKPFGFIPIDAGDIAGASTLYCKIVVDIVSGKGILTVSPTNDFAKPISITSCQLGVPIQLAQITRDSLGGISSVLGGVAGAVGAGVTGNVGGVIMSSISGITSAVAAAYPAVSTSGANGSIAAFQISPSLTGTFYPIADEDLQHYGRPLCQVKTINTLSGYVLCADGDINIDCTKFELDSIKSYLEEGFFYE